MNQKITPCIWFDKNCEEAVNFYISVFPNSKTISIKRYEEGMKTPGIGEMKGKILTAIFELDGYRFMALDGGPIFKPTPAISFILNFDPSKIEDAKEKLNNMWKKLNDGGKALMPLQKYDFSELYGWTEDKYGVSWQLMLTDPKGEERPFIIPSFLFVGDKAGKAEEAVDFWLSVFKDSKKGFVARYPKGMEPDKEYSIMFSDFMLENQWFGAMDSAHKHEFTFTEGLSFEVETTDQDETDYYWNKLTTKPEFEQCGWLKDKYGVSWQIIPKRLGELLEIDKSNKVLNAMLEMKKIDIKKLEDAYDG